MFVYAVDVGTTNVKVVLYDEHLRRRAIAAKRVHYSRTGDRVEFDASGLFDDVLGLVSECASRGPGTEGHDVSIVLTGQAESLVLTGNDGHSIRPAMSWMDERAASEATELGAHFGDDEAFAITGEPFPSSTWPAAKLRWLRAHEPRSLSAARQVLMIKDYLTFRFTGVATGEVTTRGFTYLWDVLRGDYWDAMLDVCGVPESALPEVVPAGSELGSVTREIADRLPPARSYRLNAGALDHFCSMVGTGSYAVGSISESAGTVLSLSMLAGETWAFDPSTKVSFHTGLRPDDIVLFNGADSGGVVLDWYRREGLASMPYAELEAQLRARPARSAPIFLPYLTGINPPDFFSDARGAFLGLDLGHDRIDLAYAVEEGVAHLLRRNVEYLTSGSVEEIVSSGGGAESAFWNQLKADVCGVDVVVPDEREATCRGAAVLALIAAGRLDGFDDAAALNQPEVTRFQAARDDERLARYELFDTYLQRLF